MRWMRRLVTGITGQRCWLKTDGLDAAITAARAGRDSTRDLAARRGRAQYVENGGAGHVDPGAVSVVLLLETLQGIVVEGAA